MRFRVAVLAMLGLPTLLVVPSASADALGSSSGVLTVGGTTNPAGVTGTPISFGACSGGTCNLFGIPLTIPGPSQDMIDWTLSTSYSEVAVVSIDPTTHVVTTIIEPYLPTGTLTSVGGPGVMAMNGATSTLAIFDDNGNSIAGNVVWTGFTLTSTGITITGTDTITSVNGGNGGVTASNDFGAYFLGAAVGNVATLTLQAGPCSGSVGVVDCSSVLTADPTAPVTGLSIVPSSPVAAPEPGTTLLLGAGLAGLGARRRRARSGGPNS